MADVRASFSGSMPEYYDRCLGPAWLDAYARDLARRLAPKPPGDVLGIACGTGRVTPSPFMMELPSESSPISPAGVHAVWLGWRICVFTRNPYCPP